MHRTNYVPLHKSCLFDMILTKCYDKMTLIVMRLEDIDQHIWWNYFIWIVVHDLEHLTDSCRR